MTGFSSFFSRTCSTCIQEMACLLASPGAADAARLLVRCRLFLKNMHLACLRCDALPVTHQGRCCQAPDAGSLP
jgi:hypothetical protein